MTIDWHYTMAWFSTSLLKISMHDNDARMVRLWKEMFCNNGENEAWFGNFELQ